MQRKYFEVVVSAPSFPVDSHLDLSNEFIASPAIFIYILITLPAQASC